MAVWALIALVALTPSPPIPAQSLPAPLITSVMPSTPLPPDRRASHPLVFEANRGQADAQVQFVARGAGYTAFLTSSETVLRLGAHATVRVKPVAANRCADPGRRGTSGRRQLLPPRAVDGDQRATYRGVRYVDIYPGIDLVYYGRQGQLEYDFIVAPGADPDRIGLDIEGAERVELDTEGALVMHMAGGDIRQPRPFAYQQIDGVRRPVAADYALDAEGHVRLRFGAYDRSQQLVIDPVITYATYLGGTGDEAEADPRRRSPPRARRRREHLSDRHDALDGLSDDGRRLPQSTGAQISS